MLTIQVARAGRFPADFVLKKFRERRYQSVGLNPLTSRPIFAVLKTLSTVKEFTETAVPVFEPAQLMTPDKRCLVAESYPGNDSAKSI